MITLFVGDNTRYTADCAKKHDANAFLIDFSNWKKILKLGSNQSFTGYTSLSDLPKIDDQVGALWELLKIADEIHYVPPAQWSDDNGKFNWTSQKNLTEFYLYHCQRSGKTIVGLDLAQKQPSKYLGLADRRVNDDPSLWISGCSVSHGIGVNDDQRYGTLIGKSLSMPTYHLTAGGTSIEWQADQILRSDIRTDDIVIWGLTREGRAPMVLNGKIIPWPEWNIEDIEYRLHETRYYKAVTSAFQVINFCDKIGCKLILLPLICTENLQMDLVNQDCYFQLPYQLKFLDLGTDKIHPGPQQHKFWADFCLKILSQ